MLIELLPELRTHILSYCCVEDVKNLALTSTAYNDTLTQHLYRNIEVSLHNMVALQLPNQQQFNDLVHAHTLRVVSGRPFEDVFSSSSSSSSEDRPVPPKEEKVINYFKEILPYCSLKGLQFQCLSSTSGTHSELEITDNMMTVLNSRCPDLSTLTLDCCDIADAVVPRLQDFSSLTVLTLRSCLCVTDRGLKYVSELKCLRNLDIAMNFQFSDEGLAHLSSLSGLEELDISACQLLTDRSLQCISTAMPRLRRLSVASIYNLTDAGISDVARMPAIRELKLSGLEVLGERSLPALTQLRSTIKALDVRIWSRVRAEEILSYVSVLNGLKELFLGPNKSLSDKGTISSLLSLSAMPHLRKLDLFFSDVSDEGFAHLSALPLEDLAVCVSTDAALYHISKIATLRKLEIRKPHTTWNFSDIGLAHLKNIPCLRDLRFCHHRLSQAMMTRIGALVTLTSLCVRGDSAVDDLGLLHLRGMSLSELDISGNRMVTDKGLLYVSTLKRLRRLNIGHCPQLSTDGIAHLERLPLLRVLGVSSGGNKYAFDECFRNLVKNVKIVDSFHGFPLGPLWTINLPTQS